MWIKWLDNGETFVRNFKSILWVSCEANQNSDESAFSLSLIHNKIFAFIASSSCEEGRLSHPNNFLRLCAWKLNENSLVVGHLQSFLDSLSLQLSPRQLKHYDCDKTADSKSWHFGKNLARGHFDELDKKNWAQIPAVNCYDSESFHLKWKKNFVKKKSLAVMAAH